jgi:hypothetical protein
VAANLWPGGLIPLREMPDWPYLWGCALRSLPSVLTSGPRAALTSRRRKYHLA